MQRMPKLMEQGPRIIVRQQRRIAFGKVADIDHDRTYIPTQLALAAHRRAPRARTLRAARKIIPDEHRNMFAVAGHLPGAGILVIKRNIQGPELQPEQAVGTVELGTDHRFQPQIGFEQAFIQIMLGLAALFRIVAPVPRLQIAVDPIRLHHGFQHLGIGIGTDARRGPDPHQQIPHGGGRLGHLWFQLEIGKAGIAQKGRALCPQA